MDWFDFLVFVHLNFFSFGHIFVIFDSISFVHIVLDCIVFVFYNFLLKLFSLFLLFICIFLFRNNFILIDIMQCNPHRFFHYFGTFLQLFLFFHFLFMDFIKFFFSRYFIIEDLKPLRVWVAVNSPVRAHLGRELGWFWDSPDILVHRGEVIGNCLVWVQGLVESSIGF